jgi:Tfp pilus assembly protein PilO
MRFILPLVLIGLSIGLFFIYANPIYKEITDLRSQVASYDQALSNSKALESERDKLTAKYNAIDPSNLDKIKRLLPDSIDNIRLILEIEQIAMPYGMALKDVKYNVIKNDPANPVAPSSVVGGDVQAGGQDYGIWDLEFSTTGTYDNFINFTRSLESNLRIVDISSIQFSSGNVISPTANVPSGAISQTYSYNFKIKTYWLKN